MQRFKSPPNRPTSRSAINVGNSQYVSMGGTSVRGRWIHLTWAGSNIDLRAINATTRPANNDSTQYHLSGRNYNSVWRWVDGGEQLWVRRSSSGTTEIAVVVYEELANFGPELMFE